jgi:hypothetical protein
MLAGMVGVGLDLLGLHLFAIELQHLRAVVVDQNHGMEKRHDVTRVVARLPIVRPGC